MSEPGVVSDSVDEPRKRVADVLGREETAIGYETQSVQELELANGGVVCQGPHR